MSREAAGRATWKRLLIYPAALAAFVVLLALWGVASLRMSERALLEGTAARGAWDERHAAEPSNRAAAQLAAACRPIGLDLSASGAASSLEARHAARIVSHLFVQSRLGGFQRRQALPADLDAFLTSHAGELDEAARLLLREPPSWGYAPDPLVGSQAPASARVLAELLLAAALQAALRDQRARADDLMLAAWRLEDAVERHPLASGWGPPLWDRSQQLAVLRLVRPADAPGWIARLDALDLRGRVADAMYASARETLARQEAPAGDPEMPLPRPLLAFRDSVARVGIGRDLRATLAWEAEIRGLEPCERPLKAAQRLATRHPILSLARGGGDGRLAAWPLIVLDEAEIEVALTRRVLSRAAGLDETPSPRGACLDDLIVEERHADGSLTLRWSGELASSSGTRPRQFTLPAQEMSAVTP